jgi:hypothetical protein
MLTAMLYFTITITFLIGPPPTTIAIIPLGSLQWSSGECTVFTGLRRAEFQLFYTNFGNLSIPSSSRFRLALKPSVVRVEYTEKQCYVQVPVEFRTAPPQHHPKRCPKERKYKVCPSASPAEAAWPLITTSSMKSSGMIRIVSVP